MSSEKKHKLKQTDIGMIPEEWQVKRVREFCLRITSGGTPSRTRPEYWDNGTIPWLKTQELTDNNIYEVEEKITQIGLENSSAKFFSKNTVLMAMYGATVGKLGILKIEATTNQAVCAMIVDERIADYRYLFYSLLNGREKLINLACGAAQQNLNQDIIKDFSLPFPSLQEQQSITKILSDIDSKIELNQQMNKTLEAVGQAVFKRWFVDFEFPNEEGKPYESSGGKMTESKLEEMPEGWTESSLGQLHCEQEDCVITGPFGSNLHASDYRETGTPLILVKHVKAGGISGDDMPLVGKHKFPEMKRYLLKIGDIVFTRVAVVGESAYIRKRNENWMISGQMLRVRANNDKINPRYLAQVFQQKTFKNQVSNYAVGSTRPSLNTKILLSFTFVLPPLKLQNAFSDLLESVDAKIENNLDEIDTLSSIRDSLMPRLMSGKIRVPVTEEKVGAS